MLLVLVAGSTLPASVLTTNVDSSIKRSSNSCSLTNLPLSSKILTTTSPLIERRGTITHILLPDEPITGADTPPINTSILEISVPKLDPSIKTNVLTGPSFGQKSLNTTGCEGSEDSVGLGPK